MSLASDGPPIIEWMAAYARTGMLFCLTAQIIALYVGHIFGMPKLQRIAITITCTYAAFMVATQMTGSYFVLLILPLMTFYATFFLTPKYVGENAC